ncbi:sigma-70 family RNA polymerase sigma factor [Streptomyces brasiliscabiei]|uniref:Sigma-70 family RNA polymerase sigma factor n=1 Tax=Streptomyces brasiliscabiei TaxID=2736302 RepID=A0ABU8GTV9_9ACTN
MDAVTKSLEDDQHGGDPPRSPKFPRLTGDQLPQITALAKEYHEPVYRYLLRATRDPHLTEDLTQETHLSMCRVFARGKVFEGNPTAYAMRVAKNALIDHVRKKVVEVPVGEDISTAYTVWLNRHGDTDPTAASVRFVELLNEVRTAINDDGEMEVWEYRFLWGMSGAEIARLLGVSDATVSRRLKAAIAKAGNTS